ncbi:MAG: Rrf2 family transcriptional regulator, partial [Rickettsiales bacterium]|nr:Rrf2 family transcriptional regulator [Rickettsiales bacterium]
QVAVDQNIKLAFLSQIFQDLKKKQLVKSIKGPGGGYILAKDPEELFLIDIFNAVNESCNITSCKGSHSCIHNYKHKCSSHFFLEDLSDHVSSYLKNISIANLKDKYNNYINNLNSYEQSN